MKYKLEVLEWVKEYSDPMVGILQFYKVLVKEGKERHGTRDWEHFLSLLNAPRFTCLEKVQWNFYTTNPYDEYDHMLRTKDWAWLFAGLFALVPETHDIVKDVVEKLKFKKERAKEMKQIKDGLNSIDNTYKSTGEFATTLRRRCNNRACINYNDNGVSVFMWNPNYIGKYRTSEKLIRVKKTELTEEMMTRSLDLIEERCTY